ncbi:hypothetical protein BU15DRAFT_43961 [Melanogaster broomeanus]|nr:hypothetical protein BU15DRAFT_43961 [Melanogaster broomeanus]
MRPLIQYDLDDSAGPSKLPDRHPTSALLSGQPPSKKRRRNNNHHHKSQQRMYHWDDPGSPTDRMGENGDGDNMGDGMEEANAEEESRELTHNEIWDDSALIDAWNSAEAEYEAYHGDPKGWKAECVKQSPLWYNKPYTRPTTQKTAPAATGSPKPTSFTHAARDIPAQPGEVEPDTAPLDFQTFVPTHDPSLPISSDSAPQPFFVPASSTTMVSQDEAFSNALSAMYWGGYWTAVYHCQSQSSGKKGIAPEEEDEEDEEGAYGEVDAEEASEDLVPAQR